MLEPIQMETQKHLNNTFSNTVVVVVDLYLNSV